MVFRRYSTCVQGSRLSMCMYINVKLMMIFFTFTFLEFNEFKATLDDRYVEKNKKDSVLVARKTRTEGAPSTTKPRSHAPGWIIHKDWSQGQSKLS